MNPVFRIFEFFPENTFNIMKCCQSVELDSNLNYRDYWHNLAFKYCGYNVIVSIKIEPSFLIVTLGLNVVIFVHNEDFQRRPYGHSTFNGHYAVNKRMKTFIENCIESSVNVHIVRNVWQIVTLG